MPAANSTRALALLPPKASRPDPALQIQPRRPRRHSSPSARVTQLGERETSRFFPTCPGAPASRPAHHPSPRPSEVVLLVCARESAGVAPRGVARGLRRRLAKGRPPPQPGRQTPARPPRAGHAHWRGPGPQPGQEGPALGSPLRCQLDSGGARAPALGGSASPRAPERPHTCPGVTSARAPGACVSCRSRSWWAGVLRTRSGSGPATPPGGGVWGRGGVFGTSGAAGIVCAAQPPACPVPAVSAARFRAGRGGVASEPAARGACSALTPAAPRQAGARSSMVGSERDEPPVLHRPQR